MEQVWLRQSLRIGQILTKKEAKAGNKNNSNQKQWERLFPVCDSTGMETAQDRDSGQGSCLDARWGRIQRVLCWIRRQREITDF